MRRRVLITSAIVFSLSALAAALLLAACGGGENPIEVKVKGENPKNVLGFPVLATKNTTRVAGADPVASAAGVALAAFPSTGGVPGPDAVSLVDSSDWQSGIAAASLTAQPVSAPILLSTGNSIPSLTQDALTALGPAGSAATQGTQVFRIGGAASPSGVDVQHVTGKDPAAIAAQIDALRQKLTGAKPDDVLLVSSSEPQYSMPAASWAARSGDPVLFVNKDSVPKPTIEALKRDKGANVYALGPPSAISDKALTNAGSATSNVVRIGDTDPVANAIAFARYSNGSFGWNITDPGHGLVIASDKDPMDAAAAAPLSASGTWGPLLITDDAAQVPESLRGFLLDIKPGYVDDPTRAVYNHVWIIGDQATISVAFQAQVDDLAEVAPVRSGTGAGVKPPPQPPSQTKNGSSSR